MKKVLVSAIAILMIAGAANAALIGLEWQGSAAQVSEQTAVNTPRTAQFYIQTGGTAAGQPVLAGIGLVLNAWEDAAATIPANGVVFQTSVSAVIPGWSTAPANNNSDLNGLQFAAIAGPDYQTPIGKTYLANIAVQYTDATPLAQYYITIKRDLNPANTSSAILDNAGADFISNDAIWMTTGASTAGKAKWAFGNWGGSAWQKTDYYGNVTDGQPANPLVLLTPEPSALALLVLGGFAALRRR